MPRSKREMESSKFLQPDETGLVVTEFPWRIPDHMVAAELSFEKVEHVTSITTGRVEAMNRRPPPGWKGKRGSR